MKINGYLTRVSFQKEIFFNKEGNIFKEFAINSKVVVFYSPCFYFKVLSIS